MVENQPNLEEMLEGAEGAQVRYRPISPERDYDRREFLGAQDELNDLEEYNEALEKDPFNVGAREDLCTRLFGDEREHMNYTPDGIRKLSKEAFKDGREGMGKYVENKRDMFLEMLDGEALFGLVTSVPLYKTGHKEHDEIVELMNNVKYMEAVLEKQNIGEMRKAVLKKAESKAVPKWAQKIIKYFAGDSNFVKRVFVRDHANKAAVLQMSLSRDAEYDADKIRTLVINSLNQANEELDNEDNSEKEKKDIWENCIRPYYLNMAKLAFAKEKKEFEEDSEEIRNKNEREAERRELGMAA